MKNLVKISKIREILRGQTITHTLISEGAEVLISELGGRILAVDFGFGNLLWTNPKIEDRIQEKDWNTGGIRTWISPERDFFYREPNSFRNWFCPSSIDPANYQFISKSEKRAVLKTKISILNMRTNNRSIGDLIKQIEILDCNRTTEITTCKIKISTNIKLEQTEDNLALWTLIQVPVSDNKEGIVEIPAKKYFEPIHYFSKIPKEYLCTKKEYIFFKINGK